MIIGGLIALSAACSIAGMVASRKGALLLAWTLHVVACLFVVVMFTAARLPALWVAAVLAWAFCVCRWWQEVRKRRGQP